jgi:hypothetical protein
VSIFPKIPLACALMLHPQGEKSHCKFGSITISRWGKFDQASCRRIATPKSRGRERCIALGVPAFFIITAGSKRTKPPGFSSACSSHSARGKSRDRNETPCVREHDKQQRCIQGTRFAGLLRPAQIPITRKCPVDGNLQAHFLTDWNSVGARDTQVSVECGYDAIGLWSNTAVASCIERSMSTGGPTPIFICQAPGDFPRG